ncbi:MAG: sensor histidine kinase [Candidatus Ranarchaeia archaeon]
MQKSEIRFETLIPEINEKIIDSIPDLVLFIDSNRKILFSNKSARKHLKLDNQIDKVKYCHSVLMNNETICLKCPIDNKEKNDKNDLEKYNFEYENYQMKYIPIRKNDNEFLGYILLGTKEEENQSSSITKELHTELLKSIVQRKDTQLQQIQKGLEKAEKMAAIGEVAATVGHDLKNPIQLISYNLYLANEHLDRIPNSNKIKTKVVKNLESIEKQLGYINRILTEVQNYTLKPNPKFQLIKIDQIMKDIFESMQIPENIQFNFKIPINFPSIFIDPVLIKRCLINLLSNSIEAIQGDGKITVEVESIGDDFTLKVIDTGFGIPKSKLKNIFNPFYTTKLNGHGFGLFGVKRIIKAHFGKITVDSQENLGTIFSIRLPINYLQKKKNQKEQKIDQIINWNKVTNKPLEEFLKSE